MWELYCTKSVHQDMVRNHGHISTLLENLVKEYYCFERKMKVASIYMKQYGLFENMASSGISDLMVLENLTNALKNAELIRNKLEHWADGCHVLEYRNFGISLGKAADYYKYQIDQLGASVSLDQSCEVADMECIGDLMNQEPKDTSCISMDRLFDESEAGNIIITWSLNSDRPELVIREDR